MTEYVTFGQLVWSIVLSSLFILLFVVSINFFDSNFVFRSEDKEIERLKKEISIAQLKNDLFDIKGAYDDSSEVEIE